MKEVRITISPIILVLSLIGLMGLITLCSCTTVPECRSVVRDFYRTAKPTDRQIPPVVVDAYGVVFQIVRPGGIKSIMCVGSGELPCVDEGDMDKFCSVGDERFRYGSGTMVIRKKEVPPI
jgi:hypothetical protein